MLNNTVIMQSRCAIDDVPYVQFWTLTKMVDGVITLLAMMIQLPSVRDGSLYDGVWLMNLYIDDHSSHPQTQLITTRLMMGNYSKKPMTMSK